MRTRYLYLAGVLLIIFAHTALGNNKTASILVNDLQNSPLAGATVHLTRADDSTRVSRISDQNGSAVFERLREGVYMLNVTYIGFAPYEKTIFIRNEQERFTAKLSEDMVTLGEVTVIARRPLIRQDGDKMIIDPEPMAALSTNTLEILESTPGLFVDQDGGIFLSNATPAAIYINGREQKMSSQDINTILRSLPPSSVERIEVIRTPSARYSASASGGIVNIILKKGYQVGRFGSLTTGLNQGFYGNQFLGVSFNNSGSKSTSYININYNSNNLLEELNSERLLNADASLFQNARTRRKSHQAYTGYGLSYDITEKTRFSYDGRINGSLPGSDSRNMNFIRNPENIDISRSSNSVESSSTFLSIQQDLGLTFTLDSLGSEWDHKFSYSFNRSNSFQDYRNESLFPNSAMLMGEGDNAQNRHYLQFQSDLTFNLPWEFLLETGINTSYQQYQSNTDYQFNINGNLTPDPFRTTAFNYNENINAAYVQLSRPLPFKLLLKTGVRMEHTNMKGAQTIPVDTSFVFNRADWFPYAYLSRPLFAISGFELMSFLIYRKTITRPGYQSLNPYVNYLDQFLYEVGNPGLKPQFADNIEINISINEMPLFAVGQNYTRDIFSQVVYQDANDSRVTVRTYDNLGKSKETYFRAIAGIPPGGRYFFAAGAQYNLNEFNGFYEGLPFSYNRGSWRFFTFHLLRLAKETRLNVSGFMMTRGQFNFYELNTFGQLNVSLNQTFLNQRLTITLSARDVLRTMKNEFTLNQGNISTTGYRYTDNQRFGVNIRYTFGISNRNERQNNMFQFENGDDN